MHRAACNINNAGGGLAHCSAIVWPPCPQGFTKRNHRLPPVRPPPLIVYLATKADFLDAVFKRDIESIILETFKARVGRSTSRREVRSWKESLFAMAKVLNDPSIPDSCGVGVEYGIPQSSKRIDLLLSGRDETGRGNLMIVELKQWESARRTDMDGLVRTRFAEGEANTSHPSYQSWSYAELLRSFNETVDQEQDPLQPCAYLPILNFGVTSRAVG